MAPVLYGEKSNLTVAGWNWCGLLIGTKSKLGIIGNGGGVDNDKKVTHPGSKRWEENVNKLRKRHLNQVLFVIWFSLLYWTKNIFFFRLKFCSPFLFEETNCSSENKYLGKSNSCTYMAIFKKSTLHTKKVETALSLPSITLISVLLQQKILSNFKNPRALATAWLRRV